MCIRDSVKTHQLMIMQTEPKNTLNCHAIFQCELFPWSIFFTACESLYVVDVGRRTGIMSWLGWPFARQQLNGLILPVISIFLFKSFISSILNCQSIVQKHFAQTCGSKTLANSQTFRQMPVLNGKTYNLWCQHDVTSSKEYLNFIPLEYLIPS